MTKIAGMSLVRPKRPPAVLICAKCVKKLADGRAIRKAFKAALMVRACATGRPAGRLVEARCLGVCPKRAVTVASGATLARGALLVVAQAADVPAALALLESGENPAAEGGRQE